MNFVVSLALGIIVGGIAIWQMSREDGEESEDSKVVSIDVINGDNDKGADEGVTIDVVAEIEIELEDEPQSSDAVEESAEEIEEEDGPQSDDTDVEAAESVEAESSEAEDSDTDIEALQQIIGIGPTYARRIYEAGITSVEGLSELTGESLQQIVTPGKSTPTSETKKWLDQARQLAS